MNSQANEMTELLGNIVQVGIVVPNIEKAEAGMQKVFGLVPDTEGNNVYRKTWYRGEIISAPVKAAFYNAFNVQLEFLEPVGNTATVWHDYLRESGNHGHALHHLRFDVENNDEATTALAERGITKYMEGTSLVDPTATFTYYDSVEAVGFIIECVTKPKA